MFEPITPDLGAYVHIAADDLLHGNASARILKALSHYNVLVFRQVGINDDTFLAFTAALGNMHASTVTDDGSVASRKGLFRIALDKDDRTQREFIRGNDYWHMDGMSYAVPVKATLLKCESAPSLGGDTGFANLHAAYAALRPEMQDRLDGLIVGHCLSAALGRLYDAPTSADFARWNAIFPRLEHPLVWKQENGRSALLIGSTANDIVGISPEAGRVLLDELLEWCTQDRFTYRHT